MKNFWNNENYDFDNKLTLWEWNNYESLIYNLLSESWVKKLNKESFIKNYNFVNLLWLYSWENIRSAISDYVTENGYKIVKEFLLEDSDLLSSFIKNNIKDIKNWNLLVGFIFDWFEVKKIIFWKQILENAEINDKIAELIYW